MAGALEKTLKLHVSNRILLAKLCTLLQHAAGKGPTEIAMTLLGVAPSLGRSVSEVARLIKAGIMWLDWEMLGDIEKPDKLATLKRVPNQLKDQIFHSGEFPDGTPIRDLSCAELRAAVNALRPGQPNPQAETPIRVARQGLVKLANAMSGLSELMLGIPELQGTREKIDAWYSELLAALTTNNQERVRLTIIIQQSSRHVASDFALTPPRRLAQL